MSKRVVIFSTKGGVGKTFIAVNLAISLAKYQQKRVCLMDLDTQGIGDMARMLGMRPEKTMADLMHALKKDPAGAKAEDFLLKDTSSGVDFLPCVLKPQQVAHLDPAKIGDTFSFLEKDYDYIIVDAGKNFSETLVASLNQANLMLLVVTPDILSIYQTKWVLDTLQSLHFPLAMLRIILNRADSVAGMSWQEVRVNLPAEILAHIPSEGKAVGLALNRGIPLVIESPRAKSAQAIQKLSQELVIREDLFIRHAEPGQLELKEAPLKESADFWQKEDLTEALNDTDYSDENDEILALKRRIHKRFIEELNLKRLDAKVFSDSKKNKELRDKAEVMVANFLVSEAGSFISSPDVRKKLVKEILDEALGLGALEDLLADPNLTDIMVNNKDEVYVEHNGRIELTSKKFISNDQVKTVIERIIAPIGRHIDESTPMVDARLPDGSRVNAIIPPLALTGPSLTIRKFRKERYRINDLISLNSLSPQMAEFIKTCVILRKNTIVSGGTGSGKTSVLNILSEFIPDNERIVTIEDAAELKLRQKHWIRLESRPPNIEGKGSITIRDIFRNTLRMRPDRIIIGECRGLETLDMLQAMNTGHDGSMTTLHANSTQDVLTRMDSLILMSGIELPIRAIREMIASAVDIIIHTARLSDGSRKITQITELAGMKDEVHIDLRDIFIFKQTGLSAEGNALGSFQATGYIPTFMEEIKIKGINLPEDIFKAP